MPSVGAAAVATAGLTKRFGHQLAVDGVDLEVPRGAVFGFLGPNGSGKTTTIRMLLGLAAPTSGTVEVLGRRVDRDERGVLSRVGALVEGPAAYPWLSGAANLRRLDAADRDADPRTRADRVEAALERVGLTAAAGKKVRAYSLGMKQRLGIAAALLRPRELLVLDEPTNGLDPQGTREVRTLVRELAHDGTTVLVSSHLLAEVEQMCTHVGVMRAGRLLTQGTLDQLRAAARPHLRLTTPDADLAGPVLAAAGLLPAVDGDALRAELPDRLGDSGDDGPLVERLVADLVAAGVRVRGVAVERPSLEERFVALTGEGFDVAG
ncbi:MAG: ABC transporter ATP-binding protein [Motilibacteraceae bacterium]